MGSLLSSISAERTVLRKKGVAPTYYQHQRVYSFCRKYCRGKSILEIGCGEGVGAYELSKLAKKVVALDKDSASIKQSKLEYRAKNLQFIAASFEDYQIKQTFDTVIALQSIEHLKNPDLVLGKIKSCLSERALVILSTPNKSRSFFNENPYHFKEYSRDELLEMLSKYFNRVKIYGLYGDEIVERYENVRKKQVLFVLNLDKLRLRRVIPKPLLRLLFDIGSFLNKRYVARGDGDFAKISELNYKVLSRTADSIDLIAVCDKLA